MEYFDDPRGVPLAPPEKPLARKGVNVGRTSGSPKRIFRGPKCRAIEAIRKSNAEREAAQSAARAAELSVPAVVRVGTQLPLTILPAQDSAVGEAAVVLDLKAFQSAQGASGVSLEDQNAEVLKKQAQESRCEAGILEVAVFPNVAARSQEYFAAGMNNMEAVIVRDTELGSWDFLLDPMFLVQDDNTTRNSLDEFLGTNNNGQTFPAVATNIGQVRDIDFFGSGPDTAHRHGASQPFNNTPERVPTSSSGTDASSGGPRYNSTQMRAASGTQILRNNLSTVHNATTNRIANPAFQGHQGFNFNEQVSGPTNPQLFQAGQFPVRHDEVPHQYVNPNWLQNPGQSSTSATNTASSSSARVSSNVFQDSALYTSESMEAAEVEFMPGGEWIAQLDRDINGGMDPFLF